jgi:ABC-type uncharacterized transport system permease subunit
MKWHPSEMPWMRRMHLPKVHAIHLHPVHWLSTHPLVVALLIAGLMALIIVFLANRADTGIKIKTLRPLGTQAAYP